MSAPIKPDNNPLATYSVAFGAAMQVGCLLLVAIGGLFLLGLLLDRVLGTHPLFLIILLLGSIPLTLFLIIRYTSYKVKRLQAPTAPQKKEETARDD
jgi:F0F1-type ATP synthase assembly protein I